jgi:hypothetical protein
MLSRISTGARTGREHRRMIVNEKLRKALFL